jgi:hypothetical protein
MNSDQGIQRIRFLHIPKTAGVSFSRLLSRFYKGEQFLFKGKTVEDLERYHKLDGAKRARIVFFTGHSPLITGEQEIDSIPTITMLRNPVERAKSYCQHVREGKSVELVERFPPDKFDLDEFLSSGDRQLQNLHARYLLGNIHYDIPDEDLDVLVGRAIDILVHRIKCFGIVEHFDESLLLFRRELGWPWPFYRRYNTKNLSKLLSFSEDHLAELRKLNYIDIQIYEAARKIFVGQIQENSDYLQDNLEQFRSRQNLYARVPDIGYLFTRSRSLMRKMRRQGLSK